MSRPQCHKWFNSFEHGRMSLDDDPKHGRHPTSTDDGHVDRVRAVIRINRCLTVCEVADEVSIIVGSYHQTVHDKLHVSAEFVPHLLTS